MEHAASHISGKWLFEVDPSYFENLYNRGRNASSIEINLNKMFSAQFSIFFSEMPDKYLEILQWSKFYHL